MKELAASHPNLVSLQSIGKSYEGRDLLMIKISSGGSGNPAVLVDAGIHAREWIAPAMALYIINQLVENNAKNSDLTTGLDWYILPVLNPDGYEYSHTSVRNSALLPLKKPCFSTLTHVDFKRKILACTGIEPGVSARRTSFFPLLSPSQITGPG